LPSDIVTKVVVVASSQAAAGVAGTGGTEAFENPIDDQGSTHPTKPPASSSVAATLASAAQLAATAVAAATARGASSPGSPGSSIAALAAAPAAVLVPSRATASKTKGSPATSAAAEDSSVTHSTQSASPPASAVVAETAAESGLVASTSAGSSASLPRRAATPRGIGKVNSSGSSIPASATPPSGAGATPRRRGGAPSEVFHDASGAAVRVGERYLFSRNTSYKYPIGCLEKAIVEVVEQSAIKKPPFRVRWGSGYTHWVQPLDLRTVPQERRPPSRRAGSAPRLRSAARAAIRAADESLTVPADAVAESAVVAAAVERAADAAEAAKVICVVVSDGNATLPASTTAVGSLVPAVPAIADMVTLAEAPARPPEVGAAPGEPMLVPTQDRPGDSEQAGPASIAEPAPERLPGHDRSLRGEPRAVLRDATSTPPVPPAPTQVSQTPTRQSASGSGPHAEAWTPVRTASFTPTPRVIQQAALTPRQPRPPIHQAFRPQTSGQPLHKPSAHTSPREVVKLLYAQAEAPFCGVPSTPRTRTARAATPGALTPRAASGQPRSALSVPQGLVSSSSAARADGLYSSGSSSSAAIHRTRARSSGLTTSSAPGRAPASVACPTPAGGSCAAFAAAAPTNLGWSVELTVSAGHAAPATSRPATPGRLASAVIPVACQTALQMTPTASSSSGSSARLQSNCSGAPAIAAATVAAATPAPTATAYSPASAPLHQHHRDLSPPPAWSVGAASPFPSAERPRSLSPLPVRRGSNEAHELIHCPQPAKVVAALQAAGTAPAQAGIGGQRPRSLSPVPHPIRGAAFAASQRPRDLSPARTVGCSASAWTPGEVPRPLPGPDQPATGASIGAVPAITLPSMLTANLATGLSVAIGSGAPVEAPANDLTNGASKASEGATERKEQYVKAEVLVPQLQSLLRRRARSPPIGPLELAPGVFLSQERRTVGSDLGDTPCSSFLTTGMSFASNCTHPDLLAANLELLQQQQQQQQKPQQSQPSLSCQQQLQHQQQQQRRRQPQKTQLEQSPAAKASALLGQLTDGLGCGDFSTRPKRAASAPRPSALSSSRVQRRQLNSVRFSDTIATPAGETTSALSPRSQEAVGKDLPALSAVCAENLRMSL